MSYLIYGEDTYRSRAKLRVISQKYTDTNLGDTNLAHIDGAKTKAEEIIRQLWASPFLAPKRLVIIHNLISQGAKDAQQSIEDFLPKIPRSTLAIFYESEKIDKRNSLFKALNRPKLAEEYAYLDPIKLRQWTAKQFSASGVPIEKHALESLIKIGPDLWRLKNEIDKLISYCPEGITTDKLAAIIHFEPAGDIFRLIDALSSRDLKTAAAHLRGRLAAGDSPIYLFSMFVYGFRTLLIVQDSLKQNPKLNNIPGIHPLVFKKASIQAKNFTPTALRAIYEKLGDLDYTIKTGIINPEIALDLFLLELCLGSFRAVE
ncbi:MAG: DNA polymerase III subunit delta [bacterium]|nr:DNA polymerase III subunit delta [bacterium]